MRTKQVNILVAGVLSITALGMWGYVYFANDPVRVVIDRARAVDLVLDLATLKVGTARETVQAQYPALHLSCFKNNLAQDTLGDEACVAPITRFNNLDAQWAAFYFQAGQLMAVRLAAKGDTHSAWLHAMSTLHGTQRTIPQQADLHGGPVVGWNLANGTVLTSATLKADQELAVIWLGTSTQAQVSLMEQALSPESAQTTPVATAAPFSPMPPTPAPAAMQKASVQQSAPVTPALLPRTGDPVQEAGSQHSRFSSERRAVVMEALKQRLDKPQGEAFE